MNELSGHFGWVDRLLLAQEIGYKPVRGGESRGSAIGKPVTVIVASWLSWQVGGGDWLAVEHFLE